MPDPISLIQSAQITTTLPLTQYFSYFNTPTPAPGPTPEAMFDVTHTFNFMGLFTQAAPFSAVTVSLVSGSVFQYYFGIRIAMTALLFVVAFVATRLGLDVPTTPIVVAGQTVGRRVNVQKLPKLPKIPKFVLVLFAIGALVGSQHAGAAPLPQVGTTLPGTINYQGRIYVDDDQFDGDGYFKFAIVNSAGTNAYWSNDGTGLVTAPFTPTGHITLTVTAGLFNIRLGDTSVTGMTRAITETVFTATGRSLRVWFNDGAAGWQRLTPDTPLDSMPWALSAANLNSANTFTAGPQTINTGGASNIGQIISGASSQSADLSEWKNSSGTILSRIDKAGHLGVGAAPSTYTAIRSYNDVVNPSGHVYAIYAYSSSYISSNNSYSIYGLSGDTAVTGQANYLSTITGIFGSFIANMSAGTTVVSANAMGASFDAQGSSAYTVSSARGLEITMAKSNSSATISTLYGVKIGNIDKGSTNYSIYTGAGKVRLGDAVDVGGNIIPLTTTYDLGSSGLWWDDIHYHTLTSHSLGVITGTGIISGGHVVSCTEVIKSLRAGGIVMENGLPHIDYASLPAWIVTPAQDTIFTYTITSTTPISGAIISTPVYTGENEILWWDNVVRRVVPGEPGLDVDALTSVNLCAMRELYAKAKKLDARQDVLTQRGLELEARVTAIEELIRDRWPGVLP